MPVFSQSPPNAKKGARLLLPLALPLAATIAWFAVCALEIVPAYLFPGPGQVGEAGYHYIFGNLGDSPYAGRFADDALTSLGRVFGGFLLAVAAGLPLGVLSGRIAVAQELMGTFINALRAVPGICWLPLALVWFGIGTKTTIFLVALAAFFPIYINSAAGARQVNPLLLQAGAMMGVNRLRAVFDILLPAAMGHIVAGLRLGLGIAWAYLVLGELTGVQHGLGAVIMDARMLGRIDMIVVGIILIAILGRASDRFLTEAMKALFKSARRSP